jgi:hypothetical protein
MAPYRSFRTLITEQKTAIQNLNTTVENQKVQIAGIEQELQQAALNVEGQAQFIATAGSIYTANPLTLGQDAFIISLKSPDEFMVYVRSPEKFLVGQRVYVTRKDTVPLGEFEITQGENWLYTIKRVEMSADLVKLFDRLDNKLKVIGPNDWVVPKELYVLPKKK